MRWCAALNCAHWPGTSPSQKIASTAHTSSQTPQSTPRRYPNAARGLTRRVRLARLHATVHAGRCHARRSPAGGLAHTRMWPAWPTSRPSAPMCSPMAASSPGSTCRTVVLPPPGRQGPSPAQIRRHRGAVVHRPGRSSRPGPVPATWPPCDSEHPKPPPCGQAGGRTGRRCARPSCQVRARAFTAPHGAPALPTTITVWLSSQGRSRRSGMVAR